MQPEGLSEGDLIDINEERGCDREDGHVPEEVTLVKKFTLDCENAEECSKCRSMTICRDTEEVLLPEGKLRNEKDKQATFRLLLISVLQSTKTP